MVYLPGPTDPFYEFMQPPADETPAQKTARQKRELDAQRVSDGIDEEIKKDRAMEKKRKQIIRVLLLGQAESGEQPSLLMDAIGAIALNHYIQESPQRSKVCFLFQFASLYLLTCLDFRMKYARTEWEKERNGWRSVVQLNIVRSIITIQKVIEAEMNGDVLSDSDDDQPSFDEANEVEVLKFTDRHQLLMIRLAPLLGVEAELKHRLAEGIVPISSPLTATPFDPPGGNQLRRKPEFSVRSWKDVVARPSSPFPDTRDTVTSVLAGCKDDMKALWDDKAVRLALKRRRLQLPDSAGLYDCYIPLFSPTSDKPPIAS
jgi:guanine nucleotide-binding protein alpha-1 subunit